MNQEENKTQIELSLDNQTKLRSHVAYVLGHDLEDVKDASNLRDDLGADSLDVVELVMEVEKQFDIEIPDEAAEEINLVSDYYPIIEKLLNNK